MKSIETAIRYSPRILAFVVGIAAWRAFQGLSADGGILNGLYWIYEKVGITIVALAPLAIWSIITAVRNERKHDITLAYIGTTAQRVGLLGTVVGIVMATVRIGEHLSNGAASAVTNALPAVGQALISTAVGFIIAIVCDFFRYLNTKSAENHATHEND